MALVLTVLAYAGRADEWFAISVASIALTVGLMTLGVVLLAVAWWCWGRDRVLIDPAHMSYSPRTMIRPINYRPVIVTEYTPPDGLRPAQMSVLMNERISSRDLTATIVDLAARRHIEFVHTNLGQHAEPMWNLRRLDGDPSDRAPFEQSLMSALFAAGDERSLDVLTIDHWLTMRRLDDALIQDAVTSGRFVAHPERVRRMWLYSGLGIASAGVFVVGLLGEQFGLGLVGLAVMLLGALVAFASRWMPKRTAEGSELLRRCLGFKDYLVKAEGERQRFYERNQIFEEYLGYAIVFGVAERWAMALKHVNTTDPATMWTPPPDWRASVLSGLLSGIPSSN